MILNVSCYAEIEKKNISLADIEILPILKDISPLYLGGSLIGAKFDACKTGCNYEDATYGAMLRGGYDFNQYFGLEARALVTFLGKGDFGGAPLGHLGLYAKPQYPINERFNIYGLLGYGYTKNLGNGKRLTYFDHDSGVSGGIGLEYDLSDKEGDFVKSIDYNRTFDGYGNQGKGWSLFVDYQRLLIKSDIPAMYAVSFGAKYDF